VWSGLLAKDGNGCAGDGDARQGQVHGAKSAGSELYPGGCRWVQNCGGRRVEHKDGGSPQCLARPEDRYPVGCHEGWLAVGL